MNFGNRLKTLRIKKKLTQQQLADLLGLTKSVISAYENGLRYPAYDVLIKIARIFKVSTDFRDKKRNRYIRTDRWTGWSVNRINWYYKKQ